MDPQHNFALDAEGQDNDDNHGRCVRARICPVPAAAGMTLLSVPPRESIVIA